MGDHTPRSWPAPWISMSAGAAGAPKVSNAAAGPHTGIVFIARSGVLVGVEQMFDRHDTVLERELALLEAAQHQLVLDRVVGETGDRVVEVAVFDAQLLEPQTQAGH